MSDVDFNQPAQGYGDGSRAMDSASRCGDGHGTDTTGQPGTTDVPPGEPAALSQRPRGRRRKAEPSDAEEEAFGADSRPDPEAMPRPRGRRHRRGPAADPESSPSFQDGEADVGVLQELGLSGPGVDTDETTEYGASRRGATQRSGGRERRTSAAGGKGRTPRRRGRRFAPAAALLTLLLIIGAGGGGGYWLLRTYIVPPDFDGSGTGEVEVVVGEGDTGSDIADTLAEANVVASSQAFVNALRGTDSNEIRPGTYELRREMSGTAAVERLLEPDALIAGQVTIPEGLRSEQAYNQIAEQTDLSAEDLENAAAEPEQLGLPSHAEGEVEGYLFPDTYTVDPSTSAEEMLRMMVERFDHAAEEVELEERAQERDLEPQEAMAIAAIVQAESGNLDDMTMVSRVIYNRLDIDMDLQMCSTCMYVIDDYGIALSEEQLRECLDADSDYATYGREGIPAGPIVSPGTDAMDAALDPEPGDWLFFVLTDPDAELTEFAETEEEFYELRDRYNQSEAAQGVE